MKTIQKTSLALLLVTTAAPAACTTDDLNSAVLVTSKISGSLDLGSAAAVAFHMSRTDLYDGDDARQLPYYDLNVDGRDVVLDTGDRLLLPSAGSFIGLRLPPGLHTLRMRTQDGIDLTSPNVELPAGMLSHVVVFGDPPGLQLLFYADDPSLVPDGTTHLRFVNALDRHQMIQRGRCLVAGDTPCTPSGAAMAFGETFETDEPNQPDPTVGPLRWWVLPTEPIPTKANSVAGLPRQPWPDLTSPITPYSLNIPIHIASWGIVGTEGR